MYDPAPGSPNIEQIIFVEGNKLDVVHSFVYLSSTLQHWNPVLKNMYLKIRTPVIYVYTIFFITVVLRFYFGFCHVPQKMI